MYRLELDKGEPPLPTERFGKMSVFRLIFYRFQIKSILSQEFDPGTNMKYNVFSFHDFKYSLILHCDMGSRMNKLKINFWRKNTIMEWMFPL